MELFTDNSPQTILILGTDMAGKDHVANVVMDAAQAAGLPMERRRGAFSSGPDRQRTSEDKGFLRLWLEWTFLATLPLHCRLLPFLAALLIRFDLRRFHRPDQTSVLVVSHTAIRLLAFALGHLYPRVEDIRIAAVTERALRMIPTVTGARTFVLDIDHRIREERMVQRLNRGTLDYFDRYMGADPLRSERIEEFLVWIGMRYLGARRIENNNLSDQALLAAMAG
jgi:hypothetical protein